MTLEQRIALAREAAGDAYGLDNVITKEVAEVVIRAAFFDLYGEEPTHVVVPLAMRMTEEQLMTALEEIGGAAL